MGQMGLSTGPPLQPTISILSHSYHCPCSIVSQASLFSTRGRLFYQINKYRKFTANLSMRGLLTLASSLTPSPHPSFYRSLIPHSITSLTPHPHPLPLTTISLHPLTTISLHPSPQYLYIPHHNISISPHPHILTSANPLTPHPSSTHPSSSSPIPHPLILNSANPQLLTPHPSSRHPLPAPYPWSFTSRLHTSLPFERSLSPHLYLPSHPTLWSLTPHPHFM